MDKMGFKAETDIEVMSYLGAKIRRERQNKQLSQKDFASLAGIPLRTYKRFEQDCNGSFENFVKVLRAFDKINFFQAIFVESHKSRLNVVEKIEAIRRNNTI